MAAASAAPLPSVQTPSGHEVTHPKWIRSRLRMQHDDFWVETHFFTFQTPSRLRRPSLLASCRTAHVQVDLPTAPRECFIITNRRVPQRSSSMRSKSPCGFLLHGVTNHEEVARRFWRVSVWAVNPSPPWARSSTVHHKKKKLQREVFIYLWFIKKILAKLWLSVKEVFPVSVQQD